LILKGRIVEAGPTLRVLDVPEQDYTRELVAAMPLLPDERTSQPLRRNGPW
jgi:ABC-type microcin C transport system duplicated ATPase subunit YejF